MNYISTRTAQSEPRTASYVIREGIAPDGGLYVPDALPALDGETLQRLSEADYCGRASHILGLFLTDFTKEELAACASAAYAPERFGPSPAPLSMLGRDAFLELWHSPTCAFKDMALQIMPWLLSLSIAKQGGGKDALILVATSGDTGKAALEGYRDVERVRILVFYPTGGVSRIQQKQMATQEGANVGVVAIRGNFDDAQTAVKRVFGSAEMAREADAHGFFFSSANSINWGRLAPQIVYYVSAYCDLLRAGRVRAGELINVCVPTGNFGNILAAYIAKRMGLPIDRLICASNRNHILTDFFETGVYDRNRDFYTTISPSMDILISSNLERLLYHVSGSSEKVAGWMQELSATGKYTVDAETLAKIQQSFAAGYADDADGAAEIKARFDGDHYLCDTHTAVAFRVAETRRTDAPMVVLSTASPFKFPRDVLTALGGEAPASDFAAMAALTAGTGAEAPASLRELDKLEVRFKTVLQPADIRPAALR